VADRPLKAAGLLGELPWFGVCAVWQAARSAAAAYAKQLSRKLAISVTTKLSKAETLIDQAATSPAKKARKLLKKAKTALKQAAGKAIRATKGKNPKLSSDCAAALKGAADGVVAGLGV